MDPKPPEPMIERDPVDDREEFEMRLKRLVCWKENYTQEEILGALIDNDAEKLAEIKAEKDACENQINDLLRQYDEASDREGKAAIVGSVSKRKPR